MSEPTSNTVIPTLEKAVAGALSTAELPAVFEPVRNGQVRLSTEEVQRVFALFAQLAESGIDASHVDAFWNAVWAMQEVVLANHASWLALPMTRRIVQYCKANPVPPQHYRKALVSHAIACLEADQPVESIMASLEARRIAAELGDTQSIAGALGNAVVGLMQLGMFAEAVGIATDILALPGIDIARDTETTPFCSTVMVNIAQAELRRHRYEEALRMARRALDAFVSKPSTVMAQSRQIQRYSAVAQALACLGRHAEAMEVISEAQGFGYQDERSRQTLTEGLGVVLGRAGRQAEAIQILEESVRQHGHRGRALELKTILAQVYESAGRFDDAKRTFTELASRAGADRAREVLKGLKVLYPEIAETTTPYKALSAEVDLRARVATHFEASTNALQRMADMALLAIDPSGARAHRVGRLAALLLREKGAAPADCAWTETAAKLSDIGYAELPVNVVAKPFPLTAAETALIRMHPDAGAILVGIDTPDLARAAELVRSHHERWDGLGYPRELAGELILIEARVVAIADAFDAMTHPRPWRRAIGFNESLQLIEDAAGTQFDPQLVPVFVRMVSRLARAHPNLDAFLSEGAEASPIAHLRSRLLGTLRIDAQLQPAPEAPQA